MTLRALLPASLLLTLTVGLPSVATAQIPDSAVKLQTVVSETNRFRVEYAEYVNNKDAKSLAAMYEDDAIVTLESGARQVGKQAVMASITERLPTYPHMVLQSDTLIAYGPTAIDMGTVRLHPTNGGEVVNKYLAVLRRTMGVWRIVRLQVTTVAK